MSGQCQKSLLLERSGLLCEIRHEVIHGETDSCCWWPSLTHYMFLLRVYPSSPFHWCITTFSCNARCKYCTPAPLMPILVSRPAYSGLRSVVLRSSRSSNSALFHQQVKWDILPDSMNQPYSFPYGIVLLSMPCTLHAVAMYQVLRTRSIKYSGVL